MAEGTASATTKPVHTLILDAGPIIKGEPPVSSLRQQCECIMTTPAVVNEIRDKETRARLETTLRPFITLKEPSEQSVKVITEFARKTGDLAVLSRTDIQLLALTYEVEVERNGGDWRLRKVPGQKRTNGPPPVKEVHDKEAEGSGQKESSQTQIEDTQSVVDSTAPSAASSDAVSNNAGPEQELEPLTEQLQQTSISEDVTVEQIDNIAFEDDSDSEGWITPSNIARKQLEERAAANKSTAPPATLQSACITTDFAMQNVLLQMNLNLYSTNLQQIKHVKTFILRCHACFLQVRDLGKQFCPRCGGGNTLNRVSCSTNANGEFKLHLKKNYQFNKRGDRYAVPKPAHGSANYKMQGGGKGGWGHGLVLSEDQKEYTRQIAEGKRRKERDIMDDDYLPSILSGDRNRSGNKPRVGAGKNVNSRKRH